MFQITILNFFRLEIFTLKKVEDSDLAHSFEDGTKVKILCEIKLPSKFILNTDYRVWK